MKTLLKLDLTGVNGNAFAIIGAFRLQAKRQGWESSEIQEVVTHAMNGTYDHLITTISKEVDKDFIDDHDEDEDDDDDI